MMLLVKKSEEVLSIWQIIAMERARLSILGNGSTGLRWQVLLMLLSRWNLPIQESMA